MNDIPQQLVDKMMVKCGRRCCICCRFRPTKLQVHHIIERANGGTNDEDNLIATCMSCHSDVHTHVPFARRFTQEELKGHRDALVRKVQEGRLPADDTDDGDEVIRKVVRLLGIGRKPALGLTEKATQLLLNATRDGRSQGQLYTGENFEFFHVSAGSFQLRIAHDDAREQAAYKHGINQLLKAELIAQVSSQIYEVTYDGYLFADELIVQSTQGN
jgi:hypothetical protein